MERYRSGSSGWANSAAHELLPHATLQQRRNKKRPGPSTGGVGVSAPPPPTALTATPTPMDTDMETETEEVNRTGRGGSAGETLASSTRVETRHEDSRDLRRGIRTRAEVEADLFGSVIHRYDPVRPNDFDTYAVERQKRKVQEDADRRAEDARKRKEAKGLRIDDPDSDDSDVEEGPTTARDILMGTIQQLSNVSTGATPSEKSLKMMQKMGWSGGGLGKDEQGIATPLEHRKTGRGTGNIVLSDQLNLLQQPDLSTSGSTQSMLPQLRKQPSVRGPPGKVILLRNMVGPGEVDDSLEAETAEECENSYGPVQRVLIFEVTDGSVPDNAAVRIFVQFYTTDDAMKALMDLNGRFFGGRRVDCRFYSEDKFSRVDLSPSDDEEPVEEEEDIWAEEGDSSYIPPPSDPSADAGDRDAPQAGFMSMMAAAASANMDYY